MMRRLTSSPKPASRVARMTSSALALDAVGHDPQAVAHRVELGEVAATPRSAGSGSRRPARARSAGRRPRRPRRRPRRAASTASSKRALHAGLVALAAELAGPRRSACRRRRRRRRGRLDDRRHRLRRCEVESSGSCPAMTSCSSAASRTVRAHGAGLVEAAGQRDQAVAGDPAVGRLHADRAGDGAGLADRAAGVGADRQRRLERGHAPPPSRRRSRRGCGRGPTGCGSGRRRSARSRSPSRTRPCWSCRGSAARPPCSRATTVASYGGTQPSRILEPQVVGRPSVARTSLTAIGTPASGRSARRPRARRSSTRGRLRPARPRGRRAGRRGRRRRRRRSGPGGPG